MIVKYFCIRLVGYVHILILINNQKFDWNIPSLLPPPVLQNFHSIWGEGGGFDGSENELLV